MTNLIIVVLEGADRRGKTAGSKTGRPPAQHHTALSNDHEGKVLFVPYIPPPPPLPILLPSLYLEGRTRTHVHAHRGARTVSTKAEI